MRIPILAAIAALAAPFANAEPIAGYDRMDVRAAHRAFPLAASIWYPAGKKNYIVKIGDNPIFEGTPASVGAAVAGGKMPLVLFSHGSGGNMDTVSWLSSKLAGNGAMVLAVNHPGSTSGDSSPRRSVRLDERAADLSAALDAFLADPAFAAHVDRDRIVAVGFSLGGATALNLAGLRFSTNPETAYCRDADAMREDCIFFNNGGVDFRTLPAGFSAHMRDGRIAGAVAIDPAFTEMADAASIAAIDVPIGLINLGDEHRLPPVDVGPEGSDLARKLPDVTYSSIAPASHFTFLAPCKENASRMLAEEEDEPICDDPAGTDRRAVHDRIAERIAQFMGL
ncbi:hypothetical protein B7H23_07495 [Notoacmeibacter marinus]|uniref:AB hydrolase-1 domain-containing protein n=1 Tax=Notoacmeibacter marinus TaxID=1876515 RepID=A0A231V3J9_9HYPH|nr:alpha/beta fold hydrolase [Notoacmeibacter marinus]OXT02717.1 hypothetical protein B7H23_07495 [Notoacmeibacter marinus]